MILITFLKHDRDDDVTIFRRSSCPTHHFLTIVELGKTSSRPAYCCIIGAPTDKISAYVDDILQPFVRELPSYIKNTNHSLERLSEIPQPLSGDIVTPTKQGEDFKCILIEFLKVTEKKSMIDLTVSTPKMNKTLIYRVSYQFMMSAGGDS
ncbi:hypothetical protein J6590_076667 [Homalodisca vitripennis]|nr:hypothetical protein J6590_076667 [Homalodisca vitripennis]